MNTNFKNLHFPTICVDGFFNDPDSIRNFALNSEFKYSRDGAWPGKRTDYLYNFCPDLYEKFCNKFFSVFFNSKKDMGDWRVDAMFQLVEPFSNDPDHIKNKGWIHRDKAVYSGVVYLTPDINPDTGTSLFQAVDDSYFIKNYEDEVKKSFYKDGLDVNGLYKETITNHNKMFKETVCFKNIYNRLIGWEGDTPHGVNTFFAEDLPRLTLVFFVNPVDYNITPLKRLYI